MNEAGLNLTLVRQLLWFLLYFKMWQGVLALYLKLQTQCSKQKEHILRIYVIQIVYVRNTIGTVLVVFTGISGVLLRK